MPEQPLVLSPVSAVADLRPYSPGRPPADIDLFLDANEAPAPSATLAAALATVATLPVHRYPTARAVEERVAALHGLEPASVLVTAGADDALERAVRAVCGAGGRAVLTTPSFEMLGRYVRLTGAEVVEIPWWRDAYPVGEVLAAGADAALVAVVSPNNPTGAVIAAADLVTLAERLPRTLIVIDHAYVEFADDDLTRPALEHPNVLVFRTFSKAWGGAGLRVGYVLGDPRVIGWLRALGQPYSVAAPSLAAIARLLDDGDGRPPADRLARVRAERRELAAMLTAFGAEVLPSQANFVLARPPTGEDLRAALAALGIAVRVWPDRPVLAGWLRITVPGDAAAFARLGAAIETALAPEALLLDMDGVLADVSRSYRAAILATARSYGIELGAADVARAKAAGDATNDWRLTRELLRERGLDPPLAEVTARFEAIYQGTDEEPGLRREECLTVPRDHIARLAEQRPLAIVTGRPRVDAERFLAEAGAADLFAALVTMEDAPSKPDPAPVRLALERLGVRRAWFVGDTPDDVDAARGAGVLPIGVVAPGDDVTTATATLRNAGAWRVLTTLTELDELLP